MCAAVLADSLESTVCAAVLADSLESTVCAAVLADSLESTAVYGWVRPLELELSWMN